MHEEQMIQLFRQNQAEGLRQFITKYKPMVEQFAFQFGIAREGIPEIVKVTFHNLLRSMDQFVPSQLTFLVLQQTQKAIRDFQRKQKNIISENESYKRYSYYFEKHEHMIIQGYLRELSNKYKLPIIYYYFHACTVEDISLILNVKSETLQMRIEQGTDTLYEKCKKVDTTFPLSFNDKDMAILLGEMRYEYDRLPEFSNVQEIMSYVETLGQKHKWRKTFPIIGGIIGLAVFSFFSISYIQGEKERIAIEEQVKSQENETDESIEVGIVGDLEPEILNYLEEAKERLAMDFGVENVDDFPMVKRVEQVLEDIKTHSPSNYINDDSKYYIDMMLTPPSVIEKRLHPDNVDTEQSFSEYLNVVSMYEYDFQEYLLDLLTEYQIPMDDYDAIVLSQGNPGNYDGPEEIMEFIVLLNQQGYGLWVDPDSSRLRVEFSYERLKNYLTQIGYHDGYIEYVEIAPKINSYYLNSRLESDSWRESIDILLKLESLLTNYKDVYDETFYDSLIYNVYQALYAFLAGPEVARPLKEQDQEVYYTFLEEHADSVYWDMVNEAVKHWEASEWMQSVNAVDPIMVRILFDERIGYVKPEDIEEINTYPLETRSIPIYDKYKENLDASLLEELSPFEIVSLYDYSYSKDEDVYLSLLSNEFLADNLDLVESAPNFALTEYLSDSTAIVHLTNWELINVTSIHLQKENGIWKIIQN
ncbi:sigma-70 RNA polymerase sigma factor region 4 domain-containing protein [Ornithinibacillus californiensis]|uniref:sigma-70 family RNA polymerase sigma factor n=1 Tax=Ornithinibacillus californiensis TaxID=161536 RepID=UPI00064DC52B|nr:sigma-70 family RNA polymerase sigma factor [Ornithinibacillus californiensis]